VALDGDHAVTASWDKQLRVWDASSTAPASKMFGKMIQRLHAHDAPVTAVARVAEGYVISGDVAGECKVFTRHVGKPLFEHSPLEEPTRTSAALENDRKDTSVAGDTTVEEGADAPALSPEKDELDETTGPWSCVESFTAAAGACVNAIVPLHQHPSPHPEEESDPAASPAVSVIDARPTRIALALSSTGSLVHCVRVVNASKRWTVEQDLDHPEGVTCMIRRLCNDGKERIVTGCMDGRVRVWAADVPLLPPPPTEDDDLTKDDSIDRENGRAPSPEPLSTFETFILESTLEGHGGCAVSALAWMHDDAHGAPDATPEAPDVSTFWSGSDSSLYFVSGGVDGRVRLWERRRVSLVDQSDTAASLVNQSEVRVPSSRPGGVNPLSGDVAGYEWVAERTASEISAAPATKQASWSRAEG